MRQAGISVILVLLTGPVLRAGIGPHNTIVVVNADSFASRAVANEYVLRRNIPACNIVALRLNRLRDFEQAGVEEFRKLVLIPVLDAIRARGLADQIDCIAYSSDIPYAAHVGGDVGAQKLPLLITPVASLNGLTFLYQKVLAKDTGYLKLDANRYAQRVIDHPRQSFTPAEEEKVGRAGALAREKKWAEAALALSEVANAYPSAYEVLYDLACSLAQGGKGDEAMAALTKAVDAGFWNAGLMQDDDDLNAVKPRQDFKDLVRRIKPPPIAICEHLTSFGGIMVEGGGQTPISAFIRAGAGGSSGTVTEPYAVQAKLPTPFIHVYYAQGATLAEAFCQSLAGPYQLLIIGDPLCRPWARIPTVSVSGIAPEGVVKGTVPLKATAKPNDPPAARFELFVDGRRQAACPRGGS